MLALIKCHISYIFNKFTTYLIVVVLLICIINNIVILAFMENRLSIIDISNSYNISSFMISKMLLVLLILFISINSYLKTQNNYSHIITNVSRVKFLISKFITLMFVCTGVVLINFMSLVVIGKMFYINLEFNNIDLIRHLLFLILLIYYLLIGTIISLLFDNIYTIIVIYGVFLLSGEEKKSFSWFNLFIPNFDLINGVIINDVIYLIMMICISGILCFIIYNKIDL